MAGVMIHLKMAVRTFIGAVLLAAALSVVHTSARAEDLYYNSSGASEKQLAFQILKLALEKSGKPYELKPSPVGYSTVDAMFDAIVNGGKIDIGWAGATKTLSERLLSVRFPIDGGLLGYRLFLIDAARQSDFAKVTDLAGLRRFIAIQGKGWGDVDTLRNAGLTVRIGPYRSLFRMVAGGRADYFPRAAFEALNEYDQHKSEVPNLAVEKTIVLKYPFALVFYVAKGRSDLRDDIERGLAKAWQDGSYKQTFLSDPGVKLAIEHGDLRTRTVIEIDNPSMPAEIGSIDQAYFYHP